MYDTNPSEETLSRLSILKTEYEAMIDCRTKGEIIRSRARWFEKSEKISIFLISKDRKRGGAA